MASASFPSKDHKRGHSVEHPRMYLSGSAIGAAASSYGQRERLRMRGRPWPSSRDTTTKHGKVILSRVFACATHDRHGCICRLSQSRSHFLAEDHSFVC